jgi:hypothetical protein
MSIDLDHAEWLIMRNALAQAIQLNAAVPPGRRVNFIMRDVFGPRPPTPPPEPFCIDNMGPTVWTSSSTGELHILGQVLTPTQAIAIANALVEHAAYARNQTTTEEAT